MDITLSLNELKRTDSKTLKERLKEQHDLIIQDRGNDAFMLVDIEHYGYLRECELKVAAENAKKLISEGKYIAGAENFIKNLEEKFSNNLDEI